MLIAAMSLEEKVALLQNVNVGVPRLGVMPLRFGEALHGACANVRGQPAGNGSGWSTAFPSPIGLGAAFDPQLWREVGGVIGREGRALHNEHHGETRHADQTLECFGLSADHNSSHHRCICHTVICHTTGDGL